MDLSHTVTVVGALGVAGTSLEVRVQLLNVSSMKAVELNVEAMYLSLELGLADASQPPEKHTIELPAQCDPEGVGAKWSKKTRTLTVTLPLLAEQAPSAVTRLAALQAGANSDQHNATQPTTAAELKAKLAGVQTISPKPCPVVKFLFALWGLGKGFANRALARDTVLNKHYGK